MVYWCPIVEDIAANEGEEKPKTPEIGESSEADGDPVKFLKDKLEDITTQLKGMSCGTSYM